MDSSAQFKPSKVLLRNLSPLRLGSSTSKERNISIIHTTTTTIILLLHCIIIILILILYFSLLLFYLLLSSSLLIIIIIYTIYIINNYPTFSTTRSPLLFSSSLRRTLGISLHILTSISQQRFCPGAAPSFFFFFRLDEER